MHIHKAQRQGGFTLVELAVVLLIIGLIVGGILRGQELISSAQLNAVQTDLNEIRTATNTFQDKFVALPGDFSQPELVSDVAQASNEGGDAGDGNGRIDVGARVAQDTETAAFWEHLGYSGLLGGVNPQAIDSDGLDATNAMSASIGGIYTVAFESPNPTNDGNGGGNAVNDRPDAHWFKLGGIDGDDNTIDVVAPVDLRGIDVKADDGNPTTGDILGSSQGDNECWTGNTDSTGDNTYNASEDNACVAFFRL